MTHSVLLIAKEEWRYWHRTKLAVVMLFLGCAMTFLALVINAITVNQAIHALDHQQQSADSRFLEQPDRHPHRMVHYGHYVFRPPSPLSIVDPGVNAFSGNAIFLEGHRQNSATFAEQQQSAGLNRFSRLTPSFLLQIIVPLFIGVIGFASVTREKESGAIQALIAQGMKTSTLLLGKWLALISISFLFLLPLFGSVGWSISSGEPVVSALIFSLGYVVYCVIWTAVVVMCSALCKKSSASLVVIVTLWISVCILLPRISSSVAATLSSVQGKIETDFAVAEAMKELGDGHNDADPAFIKLKAKILAKYQVDSIQDLPVNFRGIVAQYSEKQLTDVLNTFAEKRMGDELDQARLARQFGWFSPTIALSTYSMSLAATGLETHHRFLREAENIRFEFVQGLNKLHENTLNYNDDINRNKSKKNGQKARISAENWQLLSDFTFQVTPPSKRLDHAMLGLLQLLCWLAVSLLCLVLLGRNMERLV